MQPKVTSWHAAGKWRGRGNVTQTLPSSLESPRSRWDSSILDECVQTGSASTLVNVLEEAPDWLVRRRKVLTLKRATM